MERKAKVWRGLSAILAILLIFAILMTNLLIAWSGQVNVFLNVSVPTATGGDGDQAYKSDYGLSDEGLSKMLEASDQHDVQTTAEGSVLLKNDNAALPLADNERKVTLFGRASADPVYRGNSGGPATDENRLVSLYDALKAEGFEINETMFDAYAASDVKRVKADPDWFIGEVDSSFYTQDLKASYENDYNDAAIVVLSRDGGEGKDLATVDRDGISYLALHDTEKDLLTMIKDSGKFKKTIVLINSAYPMELDWLNAEDYGVDAALWIGTTGLKGFTGVAQILDGKVDPSGRLVDTYAANSLSAPAVRNSGDFTFANSSDHYIVEAEGIYIGYRYYETRYHDQVLGIHNADSSAGVYADEGDNWDYAEEMVYPYGYGLSYADFSQEVESIEWNKDEHTVTAVVNVTNNGAADGSSYAGKSKTVAELYVSLPYQEGQAEKSAIQMIGFAKSSELAPGESEKLTIQADDYLFATYDKNATNGADTSKTGCYVFDSGDYYFAVGKDCHDALNNVLAASNPSETDGKLVDPAGEIVSGNAKDTVCVMLNETDNTTYAVSPETGEIVSNQFDDVDLNYFKDGTVTYLTREDWNTYPEAYTDINLTAEMKQLMADDSVAKDENAPAYDSFTQEADNNLTLADMKDVPYEDDETWNKFLDQLSLTELTLITGDNFGQGAIEKIVKPTNVSNDGPAGTQGTYRYGDQGAATMHVGETVAAATWNQDLLYDRGSFIAEDCLFVGTQQLWSPGANIHRTPFSGRNFEYYSEDSIMSYIMSASQTRGMQDKGLNAAVKHFCANDQETNRTGLCTFMTEQAYRQGPLKGFEGAFTKGGALGTMMSCSRIGFVRMYQSAATLTQVLRNEWGFKGVTITDSVKGATDVPTVASLAAGSDTFNADTGRATEIRKYLVANKDGQIMKSLRDANKHFYYAMSRSNLINGLSSDTVVKDFVPWWQYALYGVCVVFGILTIGSLAMFGYVNYGKKRKENKQDETVTE